MLPFSLVRRSITADELWRNYEYFSNAVRLVATEVGRKMSKRPAVWPAEKISGVARIFNLPDAYKRAFERSRGSNAWRVNLCRGTFSEMPESVVADKGIRASGPLDRIRAVGF